MPAEIRLGYLQHYPDRNRVGTTRIRSSASRECQPVIWGNLVIMGLDITGYERSVRKKLTRERNWCKVILNTRSIEISHDEKVVMGP